LNTILAITNLHISIGCVVLVLQCALWKPSWSGY